MLRDDCAVSVSDVINSALEQFVIMTFFVLRVG
jgi:hypothetical protein